MGLVIDIFLSCIALSPILIIGFSTYDILSPDNHKCAAKITFKSFKQFYLINPERWVLYIDYVECIIPSNTKYGFLFDSKEQFYFNFFDYQKYKKFLKKVEQDKIDTKNMQATAKLLNAVKQDIANMERLAQQQKKQAVDNLNAILKNL